MRNMGATAESGASSKVNPPSAGGAAADGSVSNEDLLRARGFEIMKTWKSQGLLRRMLVTWRHFLGLLFGGLNAQLATRTEDGGLKGGRLLALWFAALPGASSWTGR